MFQFTCEHSNHCTREKVVCRGKRPPHPEMPRALGTVGANGQLSDWVTGSQSDVFHGVVKRFSYLRQFSPVLLRTLEFFPDFEDVKLPCWPAVQLLRDLNNNPKRKLPKTAPIDFIPKRLLPLVVNGGSPDRRSWANSWTNCGQGTWPSVRLGNLMLLPPKLNSALQNKPAKGKAVHYRKTGLLIAGEVADVIDAAGWKSKSIKEREERLLEWAAEEWADT